MKSPDATASVRVCQNSVVKETNDKRKNKEQTIKRQIMDPFRNKSTSGNEKFSYRTLYLKELREDVSAQLKQKQWIHTLMRSLLKHTAVTGKYRHRQTTRQLRAEQSLCISSGQQWQRATWQRAELSQAQWAPGPAARPEASSCYESGWKVPQAWEKAVSVTYWHTANHSQTATIVFVTLLRISNMGNSQFSACIGLMASGVQV